MVSLAFAKEVATRALLISCISIRLFPPHIFVNICIVAIARLGDTVCQLPALWALRDAYPKAHICLVSQAERSGAFVTSREVLECTGLVDSFETIVVYGSNITRWWNRLRVIMRMRSSKWDVGIVLMPNCPPASIGVFRTLQRYLKYFGCYKVLSAQKVAEFRRLNGQLERLPHVSDNLLEPLQEIGIRLPPPQNGKFFMPIRGADAAWAANLLDQYGYLEAAGLIAVATSANRPANVWPIDRYMEVLRRLWLKHRLLPVFFGGADIKHTLDQNLPSDLPHIVCAGERISRVFELTRRCSIYLGNDTGLMHVAVAVGVKCVVVSSARDAPGAWAPYGEGHKVLRSRIECEGCLLDVCIQQKHKCLTSISTEDVEQACEDLLGKEPNGRRSS